MRFVGMPFASFQTKQEPEVLEEIQGATRLGATGPAALRGKWHSERGSERVSERVPGDLHPVTKFVEDSRSYRPKMRKQLI